VSAFGIVTEYNTFDDVPQSDALMILGDFDARVGVFDPAEGLWHGTIGSHGIVERNLAGEEFLQYCESNQLTVLNTYFQKKLIDTSWTVGAPSN